MGKPSNLRPEEQCEYRRCGGKGGREVASPRRAWARVVVDGCEMRVCESCANLLRRSGASREEVRGPARVGDIMRAMALPFESASVATAERQERKKEDRRRRSARSGKQVQPSDENCANVQPTSTLVHPGTRADAPHDATLAPHVQSGVAESLAGSEPGARHIRRRPGGSIVGAHPVARAELTVAPLPDAAHEVASPEQRLHQLLRSRGCEVVDSRPKGGVLWIIGGDEHAATIREARALGYAFTWSAAGGKKTRGRAGWWCS